MVSKPSRFFLYVKAKNLKVIFIIKTPLKPVLDSCTQMISMLATTVTFTLALIVTNKAHILT